MQKASVRMAVKDLLIDVAITVAIVGGLMLLGESLLGIIKSPLFIVLTIAGLAHIAWKVARFQSVASDN